MMSKNDIAWKNYFDETDSLQKIINNGYVYVRADELKKKGGREARLMVKLDTLSTRPDIFKKNDLTIFPVKNGRYIIFEDPKKKSYYTFSNDDNNIDLEIYNTDVNLSTFDSFPKNSRRNESQALDFAFVASLIKHFTSEKELYLTIRNRIFSDQFKFFLPERNYQVDVSSVQIEIDGGYESQDSIYIIEAKVGKRDDFHIRQLYYPYLEWRGKTQKRIVPIFLSYSNGKYYFYEFEFSDAFGDLHVVRSKSFSINESPKAKFQVSDLLKDINQLKEPKDIPYPQADDLDKAVDLISFIEKEKGEKEAIATAFEFDIRQSDYYGNAGCYLGLLEHREHTFSLSELGKSFLNLNISDRNKFIVQQLLKHPTFQQAFRLLLEKDLKVENISNTEIKSIIAEFTFLSAETISRRASTMRSWLKWIVKNSEIIL